MLPLSVGKKWSDDASGSYSVVSMDTVSWSGGAFYHSYHLVQTPGDNGHNEFTHTDYWIVPNIGIVKFHYYDLNPSFPTFGIDVTWTLRSYKIP